MKCHIGNTPNFALRNQSSICILHYQSTLETSFIMNLETHQSTEHKQSSMQSEGMDQFSGQRSASPPPFQFKNFEGGESTEAVKTDAGTPVLAEGGGDLLTDEQANAALAFYAQFPEDYPADLVKRLQGKLGIVATGTIDKETVQALAGYQKANDLPINGKLDAYTLPKIFAFGLATPESQESFLKGYLGIDFSTHTTTIEKMSAFTQLMNDQLRAVGVPPVKALGDPAQKDPAQFRFRKWKIAFNTDYVANHTDDQKGLDNIANACIHEARHAEQTFSMARRWAGLGLDATQLSNSLRIPLEIAEKAVASPFKDHSEQALVAGEWWDSEYGSGLSSRKKILSNYNENPTTENYNAIRSLPEEADAYRVGDEFSSALGDHRSKTEK